MVQIIKIVLPVVALILTIVGIILCYTGLSKDYVSRTIIVKAKDIYTAEKQSYFRSMTYFAPGFLVVLILLFYFSEWQRAIGFLAGGVGSFFLSFLAARILSVGMPNLTLLRKSGDIVGASRQSVSMSLLLSGILALLGAGVFVLGEKFLFGLALGAVISSVFVFISMGLADKSLVSTAVKKISTWYAIAALSMLIISVSGTETPLNLIFAPIYLLSALVVFYVVEALSAVVPRIKNVLLSGWVNVILGAIFLAAIFFPIALWLLKDLGSLSYLRAFALLSLGVGTGLVFKIGAMVFGRNDSSINSSLISPQAAKSAVAFLVISGTSIYAANYFGGVMGLALVLCGAVAYGLLQFFSEQKGIVAGQLNLIKEEEPAPSEIYENHDFLTALSILGALAAFLVLGQGIFGRILSSGNLVVSPLVLIGATVGVVSPIIFLSQANGLALSLTRKAAVNVFGLIFVLIVLQFVFGLQLLGGVVFGLVLASIPLSFLSKFNSPVLVLSSVLGLLLAATQAVVISSLSLAVEWRYGILGLIIILLAALILFVWRPDGTQQKTR